MQLAKKMARNGRKMNIQTNSKFWATGSSKIKHFMHMYSGLMITQSGMDHSDLV